MRDVVNCIKKYVEITDNEKFILHWKRLSEKFLKGIQESYKLYEPKIVEIIEKIINNIGQFDTRGEHNRFNISTNSVFIHGNKSQVEFEYYDGKSTRREFGDIIFILSIVYNNRKFFEKMTITQIKKSKNVSWNFNGNSAKEQLYLLSRFPTFRGTNSSIIPMKDYNLPNYSGCLGSHGLLYYLGDFAFISSKQLDAILSGKNKLKLENLALNIAPNNLCFCFPCYYLLHDFEKCVYLLHVLSRFHPSYFRYFPLMCNLPVLGNSCISYNVYDFSDKYLRGLIGELIYAKKLPCNRSALQFLQDLLYAIKRKAKRKGLTDVFNFVSSFYRYGYSGQGGEGYGEINYEGGGIGIIHTTMNLGEGE